MSKKKKHRKQYQPEGQPDVVHWIGLNPDQARASEILAEGNPKTEYAPGGIATMPSRDGSK